VQNPWELVKILQIHLDLCKIHCKLIVLTDAKFVQNNDFWVEFTTSKISSFVLKEDYKS
jgi:hypothetical protein